MNTSEQIDEETCNRILRDPTRLAALAETKQLNSARLESLDRITRLAAKILNAPLTIVSLIGDKEHFFKSFHGLPEPWASNPVIPIDNSVCRYSLAGDILSLSDVRTTPLLANNPAVPALNLVAYLGVPLIDHEGNNLGAFCAIEYRPRTWSNEDVEILKDLTSIVLSEIFLIKKLADLKEALKARDKAIAMVAHDLRGPIAAIKGYADLIGIDPDPDFQSEGIEAIKRLTDKSINIMESYLDTATSPTREVEVPDSQMDLNKTVLDTIAELQLIHGKLFDFQFDGGNTKVRFDKVNFIRALENLASNAVKYGDVNRRIRISIQKRSDSEISVSVRNFGNELSELEIRRLLAEGNRTERAKESGTKGWGLGLNFVKKVLEENRSTLDIRSSTKEGTIFEMILPVLKF